MPLEMRPPPAPRAGPDGVLERTGATATGAVLTGAGVLTEALDEAGVLIGAEALAVPGRGPLALATVTPEPARAEDALWDARERLALLGGTLRSGIAGTAAIPETAIRPAPTPGASGASRDADTDGSVARPTANATQKATKTPARTRALGTL